MPPFYESTNVIATAGRRAILAAMTAEIEAGHAIRLEDLAVTWIPGSPGLDRPVGFGHRGSEPIYPASVVKLFLLAAFIQAVEAGSITSEGEDARALAAMIRTSSNDATSHVVDRLTGTTGGPDLPEPSYAPWHRARHGLGRLFETWGWPELEGTSLLQKTYSDGPYGREWRFRRETPANRLTTDATARLLRLMLSRSFASPEATSAVAEILSRDWERQPEALAEPENQVTGFLVEGLPMDAKVWSKAGWTSTTRHDAVHCRLADGREFTLVAFTQGKAMAANARFLPALAHSFVEAMGET